MAIDGINTAMTALQFARARGAGRAVETTLAASGRRNGGVLHGNGGVSGRNGGEKGRNVEVLPAIFHWSYGVAVVEGRAVAKRKPQLADSDNWSYSINRLG